MRSDVHSMSAIRDNLSSRAPTSDGRAAERKRHDFPESETISIGSETGQLTPVYDLMDTLERRWSSLRYSEDTVDTKAVLSALSESMKTDSATWQLDSKAGALEAFAFVFRSDNLQPGVYRMQGDSCQFIAALDELGDPNSLGVQREFSTGAGIISVYANLDAADSWAGPHGYRISMVRASMATYDFHLRCQSMGLVGTIFGGFIPSSVRKLVSSDGVVRQPLLAVTYSKDPDAG